MAITQPSIVGVQGAIDNLKENREKRFDKKEMVFTGLPYIGKEEEVKNRVAAIVEPLESAA